MILVLTHEDDASASMVVRHLGARGAAFMRFDTAHFPARASFTVGWKGNAFSAVLSTPGASVALDDIGSVYNRRPRPPEIASDVGNAVHRDWAKNEASHALTYLWTLIQDRFWLNPVLDGDKPRLNKWIQMRQAAKIGFSTPNSLLTNDPDTAMEFWEINNRDVIIKSVRTGYLSDPASGTNLLLMTSRVGRTAMEDTHQRMRIKYCPVFLQARIPKLFELRITIVGHQVFACRIDSQDRPDTQVDWRLQFATRKFLPHSPYQLPDDVSRRCIQLVKKLGLHFGAIDMIVTPEHEYVFVEVNPNGQWGWIEMLTGMPIAAAIADLLISGGDA